MSHDTIPNRLLERAHSLGASPALYSRQGTGFTPMSWRQYADACLDFAGALIELGWETGDAVAICGENSAEWLVADIGAMFARGVAAGIYQTSTPEQLAYVAAHCEAKVLVLEDHAQWRKVDEVRAQLPAVKRIVMIRDAEKAKSDALVMSFDEFVARGRSRRADAEARMRQIEPGDLATLIYTSGTTGPPKGVMLSHENLAFTAGLAIEVIGQASPDDCVVSYLPLSHIAEQMFSIHVAITAGYPIWVAGGFDKLKDTLVVARPTIFMGVPRVWEKFQSALEGKLAQATGLKKHIVGWARGVGASRATVVVDQGEASAGFQYRLARKLFFGKLAAALGLDRLRIAVSGAAPISRSTLDFFLSIGIVIHEVYGQSEGSGPTTFNQPIPGKRRIGTVGLPIPRVEVKIAGDGEILLKGKNVFVGYFKAPEDTAEVLKDGWLYSGDVGEFDAQGFLRITDRKKDLLITAGGKNVAPQNIEKLLKGIAGVGQAVVIGDRRKYLTALLTLDAEKAPALAKAKGWPEAPAALATHPSFLAHVQASVEAVNGQLARYEAVKKFKVLPVDFSPETGEMTPTQKVKRKVVGTKYAAEIESLYGDGD